MNKRLYEAVKSGKSDNNIDYGDFQNLIVDLGFVRKRQNGSHVVYYHDGIMEIMNIQKKSGKAKAYQVEQLRKIILKHNL